MRRCLVFAALTVGFLGCGKGGGNPDDPVVMVADDDAKMNAAMDKARKTVEAFIAALKSPKAGQVAFSVKAPFADGEHVEHMWLAPVSYDGANFQGVVNNDPALVKNVKIGDQVTVAPDKISDWMYVDGRKLVGGETLRALRDGLGPKERAEFDESVPFVIE